MSAYINFLGQAMDVSALMRKATSDNVANFSTPNYKAVEVDFERFFEKGNFQVKKTNEKHIMKETNDSAIYQETKTEETSDGNNVDLNKEMVEMIKNNYRFNMVVSAFNQETGLIRTALGQ